MKNIIIIKIKDGIYYFIISNSDASLRKIWGSIKIYKKLLVSEDLINALIIDLRVKIKLLWQIKMNEFDAIIDFGSKNLK